MSEAPEILTDDLAMEVPMNEVVDEPMNEVVDEPTNLKPSEEVEEKRELVDLVLHMSKITVEFLRMMDQCNTSDVAELLKTSKPADVELYMNFIDFQNKHVTMKLRANNTMHQATILYMQSSQYHNLY